MFVALTLSSYLTNTSPVAEEKNNLEFWMEKRWNLAGHVHWPSVISTPDKVIHGDLFAYIYTSQYSVFFTQMRIQKYLTWIQIILAFSTICHPQAESGMEQTYYSFWYNIIVYKFFWTGFCFLRLVLNTDTVISWKSGSPVSIGFALGNF